MSKIIYLIFLSNFCVNKFCSKWKIASSSRFFVKKSTKTLLFCACVHNNFKSVWCCWFLTLGYRVCERERKMVGDWNSFIKSSAISPNRTHQFISLYSFNCVLFISSSSFWILVYVFRVLVAHIMQCISISVFGPTFVTTPKHFHNQYRLISFYTQKGQAS